MNLTSTMEEIKKELLGEGEEYTEASIDSEEGGGGVGGGGGGGGTTDNTGGDVDSCILRTSITDDDDDNVSSVKTKPLTEARSIKIVAVLDAQQAEAGARAQSLNAADAIKEQPQSSMGQKPLMPIELVMLVKTWNLGFDGLQNPFEFIERLEEMTQLYRIDKDQLPNLMPIFLSKDALTWYRNNRRSWDNWESFRSDLLTFFLPAKFKEDQKNAIRWRWQRPGESFKSYMLGLQSLMRVTDLTEEEQLDRIYINSRPELRLYVKRENFRTLPELISYATDYELICQQQIHQSNSRHFHSKGSTCERCGNMDYWPHSKRSTSVSKRHKRCYSSRSSFTTTSSNSTQSRAESSNDEDEHNNDSDNDHDDDDDEDSTKSSPHRKPVKVLHHSKRRRHHGMNKDAISTASTASTVNSNPKNPNCTTDTQSRTSVSKVDSCYVFKKLLKEDANTPSVQ